MLTRIVYLSFFASFVAAHGLIVAVKGANGVTGIGLGVDPSTPRDGSELVPYGRDTSIINAGEIDTDRAGQCGRTLQSGSLDLEEDLDEISGRALPSTSSTGELQMTLHRVDGDGAGPYECDISIDGDNFAPVIVLRNVPGYSGPGSGYPEDYPLNVEILPGTRCRAGPSKNVCIVRCRNNAPAGPFGSCAFFTTASSAGRAVVGSRMFPKSTSNSAGLVRWDVSEKSEE